MHQLQAEVEVGDRVVRGQTELPSSRPGWQSWQGTMRFLSHPIAYTPALGQLVIYSCLLRMKSGGLCM